MKNVVEVFTYLAFYASLFCVPVCLFTGYWNRIGDALALTLFLDAFTAIVVASASKDGP